MIAATKDRIGTMLIFPSYVDHLLANFQAGVWGRVYRQGGKILRRGGKITPGWHGVALTLSAYDLYFT